MCTCAHVWVCTYAHVRVSMCVCMHACSYVIMWAHEYVLNLLKFGCLASLRCGVCGKFFQKFSLKPEKCMLRSSLDAVRAHSCDGESCTQLLVTVVSCSRMSYQQFVGLVTAWSRWVHTVFGICWACRKFYIRQSRLQLKPDKCHTKVYSSHSFLGVDSACVYVPMSVCHTYLAKIKILTT